MNAGVLHKAVAALVVLASGVVQAQGLEEVSFEIQGVRPPAAMLVIALFRASSPEWNKRFKRVERADLRCQRRLSGARASEDLSCPLEPGEYIALAFSDTDGNGTLTHGALGPTEAFGLSGVGRAITLPPEASRTVFDTRKGNRFVIVLN